MLKMVSHLLRIINDDDFGQRVKRTISSELDDIMGEKDILKKAFNGCTTYSSNKSSGYKNFWVYMPKDGPSEPISKSSTNSTKDSGKDALLDDSFISLERPKDNDTSNELFNSSYEDNANVDDSDSDIFLDPVHCSQSGVVKAVQRVEEKVPKVELTMGELVEINEALTATREFYKNLVHGMNFNDPSGYESLGKIESVEAKLSNLII